MLVIMIVLFILWMAQTERLVKQVIRWRVKK
jgi:hypothetical protein